MVYMRHLAEQSFEASAKLEKLVLLDRATTEVKKDMGNKLSQVVYEGKWFTPLREAIQAFVESIPGVCNRRGNSNLIKVTSSKPEQLPTVLTLQ